jgi:hypothetical protein
MTVFKAQIASLAILIALIFAVPGFAQSKLKTKTDVTVSDATTVFGEPVVITATVTVLARTGMAPTGVVSFEDLPSGERRT